MPLRTLILLASLLLPINSMAEAFPQEGTYYIFVAGVYSGKNTFKSKVEGPYLILSSHTALKFEDFELTLDCETKLEKNTLKPISFTYEGIKPVKREVYGHVYFKGDSVIGKFKEEKNEFSSRKLLGVTPVFFENYVAEHEILLARRILELAGEFNSIILFFPSDFFFSKCSATIASKVELRTKKGAMICTKLEISQQGALPFYPYLDMDRKIPIYIDFPGSATELFLDGYFDKNSKTKYHKLEKK